MQPEGDHSIPPLPSRWWFILPFVAGAGVGLLQVSVWITAQPVPLRVGSVVFSCIVLALVALFQVASATTLYGTYLSNIALTVANHQLTTTNDHLMLLATTDSLTGLVNRVMFHERFEQSLQAHVDAQTKVALLLMDLDHFKEVNDTLGHGAGDRLLRELGGRLLATLAGAASVARLGGDEFAVLLAGCDVATAVAAAHRCLEVLETPFQIDNQTLTMAGSIGVAIAPDHGHDVGTLLRCADVAMYNAKRRRSGYALYTPADDQHSRSRLSMVTELQQAIQEGALRVYYQPTMNLQSGEVRGVEALVRWHHARHGLLPPDQFIPLAEQTGLIVPLTKWVLATALKQCRAWQDAGLHLAVAVNLSMRNLQDPHLPEVVASLLHSTGVEPHLLTLEITETMLMADPTCTLEVLARLDDLGVRLSIDDFGTGHSSLGYLKQLPVDELKIDRAFVLDLDTRRSTGMLKGRTIVRSVTAMAHALGLEVVAEGVESQDTFDLLGALRCNVAQGYFLSRPLPPDELEQWVRALPPPAKQQPARARFSVV